MDARHRQHPRALVAVNRFVAVFTSTQPIHDNVFSGLLVDQVLGIEQFTQDQYRAEALEPSSPFAPYNHGKFVKDEQDWYVFMPSLLAQDLQYTDAAI